LALGRLICETMARLKLQTLRIDHTTLETYGKKPLVLLLTGFGTMFWTLFPAIANA
jgi:hypothetical protein